MKYVYPEPKDISDHAQLLLGLADDPNDVETTSDSPHGIGFRVPDALYELYLKALEHQEQESADEETPAKRKPGRPKNTDKG